jgi:hypothetical protein
VVGSERYRWWAVSEHPGAVLYIFFKKFFIIITRDVSEALTFHLSLRSLNERASFQKFDGNNALLRCWIWLHLYSGLRLERVRFFESDSGYLLLKGLGKKYLVSSNLGKLSVEVGQRNDLRTLYCGENEEQVLRVIIETEYGLS